MRRDGRSALGTIAQAGLLLLAVAIGAHVVYGLLRPLLPTIGGIALVMALAYVLLGRR